MIAPRDGRAEGGQPPVHGGVPLPAGIAADAAGGCRRHRAHFHAAGGWAAAGHVPACGGRGIVAGPEHVVQVPVPLDVAESLVAGRRSQLVPTRNPGRPSIARLSCLGPQPGHAAASEDELPRSPDT